MRDDPSYAFLEALRRENRHSTADCYRFGLHNFQQWLERGKLDPLKLTRQSLEQFQRWLCEEYRSPAGRALCRGTLGTRISAVKSFYKWLYRRGLLLVDLAPALRVPTVRRGKVSCDHLTQQETIAIVQTQAGRLLAMREGTKDWAVQFRNLALLCLAIATGRRRMTIVTLKVADLDFKRHEIRIDWEKGKPGRVLPCAGWALAVADEYVRKARPLLSNRWPRAPWLFTGVRTKRICGAYLGRMLRDLRDCAVREHPDLEELRDKRLSTHSLRVTFATMLFLNGANIRCVNELLMHERLTTTARYTPLELDDVRRALKGAHPRA